MTDVYEDKACCNDTDAECCKDHTAECCTDKADAGCCENAPEGCEVVEFTVHPDHWANVQVAWDSIQEHLNKAASDVRGAVSKGADAAEPVFREKVAPVLADATSKLAEMADAARKSTSEKAGFADDEAKPVEQISAGLAGIATGLLGLSKSLSEWLSQHAASAAAKEVKVEVEAEPETVEVKETEITVPDEDIAPDVTAVADLLQQPVYVADGDIEVVEPNQN